MAAINFDTANTGYGGNYGGGYAVPYYGGYCNDNNLTEAVILAALLGNGFNGHHDGHGHDCHDKCCEKMIDMHDHHDDHNHTVDEIHDVEREVCASERQMAEGFSDVDRDVLEAKYALSGDIKDCCCGLDRDILETKFDLSKEILNSRFENALQGKDIIREIDLQSCKIEKDIADVKFNQLLIAKDAQAQLDKCCCELKEKIRDSIDVTRQESNETQKLMLKIDNKNDLKDAERERRELERRLDNVKEELRELRSDKRERDGRDEQNILNNFGTITDSLNKVITALGNTAG